MKESIYSIISTLCISFIAIFFIIYYSSSSLGLWLVILVFILNLIKLVWKIIDLYYK